MTTTKTPAKLTEAQTNALHRVRTQGTLYAYNGVSRATIAVLERCGLVVVDWKTTWVETYHHGVWRKRPQLDWTARPAA